MKQHIHWELCMWICTKTNKQCKTCSTYVCAYSTCQELRTWLAPFLFCCVLVPVDFIYIFQDYFTRIGAIIRRCCPSASEATMKNMNYWITWITRSWWYNHNKKSKSKSVFYDTVYMSTSAVCYFHKKSISRETASLVTILVESNMFT